MIAVRRRAAFSAADELLHEGLRSRYTAVVLRVEHRGALVFERALGCVDDGPRAAQIDPATRFDLASITKIYVATAALAAAAQGRLTLDGSLCELVPEWQGTARAALTLRMLLSHCSGMQSGADYRELLGSDVRSFALLRALVAAPGERVVYSDLGFIALGVVLERAYGSSLASIIGEMCVRTEMRDSAYRPAARLRSEIPATEEDRWRGRVRGWVHDEKAHLMDGVAGHAGLFGTAYDVARLAEAYLAPRQGRPAGILPLTLAREAIEEQAYDPVLRRGLGWALKTSDENSCGTRMHSDTFGHTGFTGTCVWADPRRDLSIVLLTNAVYFGRKDLRDVRAALCDAVTEAVDACWPSD